jgi:hypothetical protein
MIRWSGVIAVVLLAACNPADFSIYLNAEVIKYQMFDKCGESDSVCTSAVEAQFDECFGASGYDKLKEFGTSPSEADAIVESAVRYTYMCIVDEDGDPFFYFPDSEDAFNFKPRKPPAGLRGSVVA